MCFKSFKRRSLINDTAERINKLISTSELATMEYTIAKVVKAEDNPHWFHGQVGDRKLLYTCKIYIKAGINLKDYDFSRIDINEVDKSISIVLPHAQMLSFNMPAEEQDLVYEKVGVLRKDFTHKERNDLLIQGEEAVRSTINELGILADAERNTADIFRAALLQLGYNKVTIKFE